MVYTVITGFIIVFIVSDTLIPKQATWNIIELPYEQTLVPGVLITNPMKIPSIWKDEEAVVSSTRCMFS